MTSVRLLDNDATKIATGVTTIVASASVAINAARLRLPPTVASSRANRGQVVKHKIIAHSAAEMKGRRVRKQPNPSRAANTPPIPTSTLLAGFASLLI